MLNTAAVPFNNKTLRQAMAMCINQAQFSKGSTRASTPP